jgi:hypothetical protein
MLGFTTLEPALAYWLSIACTAICVIYGVLNWNDAGKPVPTQKHIILPKEQDQTASIQESDT